MKLELFCQNVYYLMSSFIKNETFNVGFKSFLNIDSLKLASNVFLFQLNISKIHEAFFVVLFPWSAHCKIILFLSYSTISELNSFNIQFSLNLYVEASLPTSWTDFSVKSFSCLQAFYLYYFREDGPLWFCISCTIHRNIQ